MKESQPHHQGKWNQRLDKEQGVKSIEKNVGDFVVVINAEQIEVTIEIYPGQGAERGRYLEIHSTGKQLLQANSF